MAIIKGVELKEGMFVAVTGMDVKNDNDIYVVESDYSIKGKYGAFRNEVCLKKVKLTGELKQSGYTICFINDRTFNKNPNINITSLDGVNSLKAGKKLVNDHLKDRKNNEIVSVFQETESTEIKENDIVKFKKPLVFGVFGDKVINDRRLWKIESYINNKIAITELGVNGQDISTGLRYLFSENLTKQVLEGDYLVILDKKETLRSELNNNDVEPSEEPKQENKIQEVEKDQVEPEIKEEVNNIEIKLNDELKEKLNNSSIKAIDLVKFVLDYKGAVNSTNKTVNELSLGDITFNSMNIEKAYIKDFKKLVLILENKKFNIDLDYRKVIKDANINSNDETMVLLTLNDEDIYYSLVGNKLIKYCKDYNFSLPLEIEIRNSKVISYINQLIEDDDDLPF